MAGPNLPVTIDATYADSNTDPAAKTHQQHHDIIHSMLNQIDRDSLKSDGMVLAWDDATQLWTPTSLTLPDGSGVITPTTYATAAPGTYFRITWNGTAWPASRPSDRADIYFNLYGAPAGTSAPAWLKFGDQVEVASSGLGGNITADSILDSTTVGRGLIRAADAAAARTLLGIAASLQLGTTSTTAKAGDWFPTVAEVIGLTVALNSRELLVRWDASVRAWEPRLASYPFGAVFLSTNDATATPPNDVNLRIGDLWRRHPNAG